MYIIAGLGNPGREYQNTRHNVGFWAIDELFRIGDMRRFKNAHKALVSEGRLANERVMLVKPQTFMNLSGFSIAEILNYCKLTPDKLIVIYDDKALPVGMLRIREQGSAGGHNGMKSIIEQLGTDRFLRVRVGIGSEDPEKGLISYVLGAPDADEKKEISRTIECAADAVKLIINGRLQEAQEKYNKKASKVKSDKSESS